MEKARIIRPALLGPQQAGCMLGGGAGGMDYRAGRGASVVWRVFNLLLAQSH